MNNKKYMSRAELVRLRRESEHAKSMERAAREAKTKQASLSYCVSHAARQLEGDSPAKDSVSATPVWLADTLARSGCDAGLGGILFVHPS